MGEGEAGRKGLRGAGEPIVKRGARRQRGRRALVWLRRSLPSEPHSPDTCGPKVSATTEVAADMGRMQRCCAGAGLALCQVCLGDLDQRLRER